MNNNNLLLIIIIISLFWACDNSIPMPPNHPATEPMQSTAFELVWATRLDFEKEIIGSDQQQIFKDNFICFGDLKDPATIYGYNTKTGIRDWEFVSSGDDNTNINFNYLHNNILVCTTSKRVFAFNLETKIVKWEVNLSSHNIIPRRGTIAANNLFYLDGDYKFKTDMHTQHLLEFNIITGDYSIIYSAAKDDFGYPGISPPVYIKTGDTELLIFNEYPNHSASPEKKLQHLTAIDLNTKEVIWRNQNISNFYSSNSLHPPIIFKNKVITGGDWSLYAFDVETGEKAWKYAMDYPWGIWTNTNHLIYDGRLYVNNGLKDVTCLNPETGALIWNNPKGGPNCMDNMLYYEKEDLLVFTSWGYASVMILDALTGETLHRENGYDNSDYNNDVAYDTTLDMFFTSTYKHAIGFKVNKPE